MTEVRAKSSIKIAGRYYIECWRDGELIWVEDITNLIVNAGLAFALDLLFDNPTSQIDWKIGLTTGTPVFAAGDTMASHAGWTENTNYDEATRVSITLAGSGSSRSNASPIEFNISATTTIGGIFATSVATKGDNTGTLLGGVAFTADRNLIDDDLLKITYTISLADDGS
jgi:hypothetical protein